MPNTRAKKNTASPKTRFHGSSNASRPFDALAQRLMTGCDIWKILSRSTTKLLPVKNVATAPPKSNGPKMPLMTKKAWNVRVPRRLPNLFWNS